MDDILIQRMTSKDFNQVRELGLATPEIQDTEGKLEFFSETILQGFLSNPDDLLVTASYQGQFAGFLISTYNPHSRIAYFTDIAIKHEFQNKSIGRKLIEYMMNELEHKNCLLIWCLVHEDNQKMIDILKRRNFRVGRKFYILDKRFNKK